MIDNRISIIKAVADNTAESLRKKNVNLANLQDRSEQIYDLAVRTRFLLNQSLVALDNIVDSYNAIQGHLHSEDIRIEQIQAELNIISGCITHLQQIDNIDSIKNLRLV